ncbi:transposase [Aneurinibacillus thermoaerophilus]|uniref:Transposase n=1 Tax=Aneurinibacillus thermoaerophilus TaxID=143495 RepID=A0ABX8YAV2_ANETH|nr:hypothetical protein ACH33_00300 [Aneurinibacillus sp. XH2]QYY42826.1 transposase [Aneurinibacillus thermoaerophilus]
MLTFLKTTFGRALFQRRSEIERVFSFLKNKQGMEQPRWHGKNRYHFHCQPCVFIHNIGFLCWFCNIICNKYRNYRMRGKFYICIIDVYFGGDPFFMKWNKKEVYK